MAEPNILAYAMLLVWPLVALWLYSAIEPAKALIWTILAGYLVLPPVVAIDFPVVPDLRKESVPSLAALLMVLVFLRHSLTFLPDSRIGKLLIGLFVLSPFATVLTNSDPIPIMEMPIPGVRIYDSVAAVANQAILLLPFFLARRYLGTADAMRTLLVALMAAGLAYSLPMLVESRLSPQINVWVYGFFQHDFFQTIRFGGYRPVVFLQHGLWVAFFALMVLMAVVALLRNARPEARPKFLLAAGYAALMVVICKSAGPVVYAAAMVPLLLFAPRRMQLAVAALLAVVVIAYPMLRGAQLIPVDRIVALAETVSPDRASSLAFRVENEEALLARAAERPWFGWGGYGRNLIRDPVTGKELSIADGEWIIQIGIYGWLGYLAEFGLLALPLLLLAREAFSRRGAAISPYACAVALILAINMVDMLPNATLVSVTWLMAGALAGYAEALARERRALPAARDLAVLRPGRTIL